MGGAEYHVHRTRPASQDLRHGIDHDLDALVRRQQAEGQDDRSAGEAQLQLRDRGVLERCIWNSVRNDVDLLRRNAVDRMQQIASLLCHHHDLRGPLDYVGQHTLLDRIRLGENRMQRSDEWHVQLRHESLYVGSGLAAEDAELMLQADDIEGTCIEARRSARIVLRVHVVNLRLHHSRVTVRLALLRHSDDLRLHVALCDGLLQVAGERSDATAARQGIPDEREAKRSIHNCISDGI